MTLEYTPSSDVVVRRNTVDFSKTPAAAADVVPVLQVRNGDVVLRAGYTVIRPDGNAAAGTLGDAADPDGFVTAGNLNAAAGTKVISPGATVGYATGRLYAADGTIDWTATDALGAAVVEFWAIVLHP